MPSAFTFEIQARDGSARLGRMTTPHGVVDSPAFMPVGTLGAVKGIGPAGLSSLGADIMLANLYHLAERPGVEVIERLGGLHEFVGWSRPLLTDSGGFQVFSLGRLRTLDDGGVTFRSPLDGAAVRLTPAGVVEQQARLGVDLGVMLDECPPWPVTREEAGAALARTTQWARLARESWRGEPAALFGVVQGSLYPELRQQAARDLMALDFPAYSIGGVSVGEPLEERRRVIELVAPILPENRPRYLMGVGTLGDILHAVIAGVDLFDCVLPSRNGRHGRAVTRGGDLQLTNARFRQDPRPIEAGCPCPACRQVSRAFLHHLARAGELTAKVLLTQHNLHVYLDFMRDLREAIGDGSLAGFAAATLPAGADPVARTVKRPT